MSSIRQFAAFFAGLALSYFHWAGIAIGGFILGFSAGSMRSAAAFGALLGFAVWLSFAAYVAAFYDFQRFASLPLSYLSLLLSSALATLSSCTARGLCEGLATRA
ncbi:MAG: hypothetical protein ABWW66_03545 [Archaeoglobaceae archaeon]